METGRTPSAPSREAARRGIPDGVVELMGIPGIGPKTAKLLYEEQRVTSIARLEALARAGKLRGLPGIQTKTEANILEGIAVVKGGQARMPIGHALPLAQELVRALEASGIEHAVIGVSGGLDSTQALLVCAQAMDVPGRPRRHVLGCNDAGLRHQRPHACNSTASSKLPPGQQRRNGAWLPHLGRRRDTLALIEAPLGDAIGHASCERDGVP